jgi:hypothetical protein
MLITNDLRDDGFGAQYQSIIWTILFAEVKGDTFLYSDIVRMDNPEDINNFLEKAIDCMNIKGNYPQVDSVGGVTIYAPKWPYFYKEIEYDMERFHDSKSFQKIKYLYYKNKVSPFANDVVNVAVHVRRPNKCDVRIEGTDTPDEYYIRCIKAIDAKYKAENKQCLFHIFSQGSEELFQEYKQFPVRFHLNEDVFDTFNHLVFADVLVLSKSSYSYVAALLSNGMIIYKPFWHPPRKHWLLISN